MGSRNVPKTTAASAAHLDSSPLLTLLAAVQFSLLARQPSLASELAARSISLREKGLYIDKLGHPPRGYFLVKHDRKRWKSRSLCAPGGWRKKLEVTNQSCRVVTSTQVIVQL